MAVATAKPTVAAGLFAAMFVLSATVMVWSGYVLLHGEQTDAVYQALPAQCEWLLLADQPSHVHTAWLALGSPARVPRSLVLVAKDQADLWTSLAATPGLDPSQPWAVCGRPDGIVAAVMAKSADGVAPGQAFFDRLQAHAAVLPSEVQAVLPATDLLGWSLGLHRGATDPKPTVALRRDGQILRVAWSLQQPAEVVLSRAVQEARTHPLQKNETVRGAFERVGGGQLHLYLTPERVRTLGQHLGANPALSQGLALATWGAAVLRQDEDTVRLHAQVGTGPHGAVWLKERFDTTTLLDAAPLVAPEAQLAAVVRVSPGVLPAQTDLPGVPALDAWLKDHGASSLASLASVSTGQAVLQVLRDPNPATAWLLLVQLRANVAVPADLLDPRVASQRVGDLLVMAQRPDLLRLGVQLAQGKHPSLRDRTLTGDTKRLLADTQGLMLRGDVAVGEWRGPLQLEWLWLDTGLVAELSLPRSRP